MYWLLRFLSQLFSSTCLFFQISSLVRLSKQPEIKTISRSQQLLLSFFSLQVKLASSLPLPTLTHKYTHTHLLSPLPISLPTNVIVRDVNVVYPTQAKLNSSIHCPPSNASH